MLCLISTATAFLQPTQVQAAKSLRMLEIHRESGRMVCRKAGAAPCGPNRSFLRMSAKNIGTDSTDDSLQQLASDIREYLKTCPEAEGSPLAYITLRNAGRLDLISRIMAAGGYIKVSRALGVPVDESQFIPPPATSTSTNEPSSDAGDDYNASLAIGRDLEARLNTIEDVMKNGINRTDTEGRTSNIPVTDEVPTGEELRLQNQTFRPAVIDEPIPVGERFTLTPGMRIGIFSVALVSAIGLGRSSHEVISDDVISTFSSLAYGLLFAHFVLGVYAGTILAPQKRRNPSLWFTKVFLGGPLGIRYLRELGVLPD